MNGLLLSAQVERVATRKDRTLGIGIETQELTPAVAGQLLGMAHQLVAVYISPKETIGSKEIEAVDQLTPEFEGRKSQSKRLRDVLWVLFQKVPEDFKDFEVFYKHKTEKIIEHFKNQIPA